MLLQAILIGLVSAWGSLDYACGTLYTMRPIVLSPLVGLILGDLQTGLAIGVSLELLFMGAISVGAYVPPDTNVGSVLATAFAISLGQSTDAAVALAMPIATLSLGLSNILSSVMPFFLQYADKAAAKGDAKGVMLIQWWMGIPSTLLKFTLSFAGFYLGAEQVQNLLTIIPQFVFDGMGVAAGILPAMGFAMLLRMVLTKRLMPFFVLGFTLSAFFHLPVLGVAIIAVIIAIEKVGALDEQPKAALASESAGDDDDF